jgi:cytochrome c oxidase cbb3-type subunit 4
MNFDVNDWRSLVTVLSLAMFVGLMVWTWARKRQDAFKEAAQLPFLDSRFPSVPAPDASEQ